MAQTAQLSSHYDPAAQGLQASVGHVAPHIQAASYGYHAQAPLKAAVQNLQNEQEHKDHSGTVNRVGSFIHHNKNWMVNQNPVGYAGYHYLRSALACVPYGLMCGLVFAGTQKLKGLGSLTPEVGEINKGWAALTNTPFFDIAAQATMIGTAFTLYRTTSFAGRRFYERVFNPENTEQQTIDELRSSSINFIDDWRQNFDIQSHSVPWAAITLGGIMVGGGKAFAAMPSVIEAAKTAGVGGRLDTIQKVGLATLGYGAFFEIADQLGKRRREREGIADPTKNINDIDMSKIEPGKVQDILDQPKTYGTFTDDSGAGRLLFRRMLPVVAGVGTYAITKPMLGKVISKTVGLNSPVMVPGASIMKNAWIEGGATSLFAFYTFVKDPWERAYDNLFEKLERKANPEFYARKDEMDKEGVELRIEMRKKRSKPETNRLLEVPVAAHVQTPAQLEGQAKVALAEIEK